MVVNPAPEKDGIPGPPLPIWAVSHDTNEISFMQTSNKLPHYGGNNGDLSATFQNGITP